MRTLLPSLPVRPVGRQIGRRSHRRGPHRHARRSMTQAPQLPAPTWFVGCGNMGRAILDGWRSAGIDLSQVVAVDPAKPAIDGVKTVATPAEAGAPPKLVVLGFKPQKLDEVAG